MVFIFLALGSSSCALFQKNTEPNLAGKDLVKLALPLPKGNSMGDVLELFVSDKAPPLSEFENCDRKYFDFRSKEMRVTHAQVSYARQLVKTHREETHWCFFVKLLEIGNPLGFEKFDSANEKKFVETFLYVAPVATAFQIETGLVDYLVVAGAQYQNLALTFNGQVLDLSPEITSTIVRYWRLKREELERERASK